MAKVPAFISHTVLIHAGSYKDFTVKLTTKYPKLAIKFVKKIAIHYFIVQLEDHNDKAISNKEIYNNLPIMALREEFSGFIFFKSTKAYNNVLKRMCNAPENEMAAYDLVQHMLTPFEKGVLLKLDEAKKIEYDEMPVYGQTPMHTSICGNEHINNIQTLSKLFSIQKVTVDDKEIDLSEVVKNRRKEWIVGIH